MEPQPVGMDGANDAPAPANPVTVPDDQFKLKFCTVCASNQNRYAVSTLLFVNHC
jgi:RNA polymerase II subunit A C-terminal domain phosphatase SSU72